MMKKAVDIVVFNIVMILSVGVCHVHGQQLQLLPQDDLTPIEFSHESDAGAPYYDAPCAGDCGSECVGACNPACMQKLEKHFLDAKHLHYLKSHRGGTAQYTHEWNWYHAQQRPWHGSYYHTDWGRPIALVVPPTAAFQTRWGWGVGSTTVTPIYHQFGRCYPGSYDHGNGTQIRGTPMWPSHTDQFGVYYVRGPW